MKRFIQLFADLDETNRTNEKVAALESYFRDGPAADAAWALHFLRGGKVSRAVTSTQLRTWAAEEARLPSWLVDECYETVGDLAETIALILPKSEGTLALPLHQVIEERLLTLADKPDALKCELLRQTWRELDARGRFVWNKLLTGGLRVGVAETLVVRALANVAGVEQAVMAHRLAGKWRPVADDYARLMSGEGTEIAKPYPFFLASPITDPAELGDIAEWQIEWKWDGIRAQLIQREGQTLIWSRGDESVSESFPEIAEAAASLPDGTVLDGEILAWLHETPQSFGKLQHRLGRKNVSAKLRKEVPVVFLAYDLLECDGADWRAKPLEERRAKLEEVIEAAHRAPRTDEAGDELPDLFEALNPVARDPLPLRISNLLQAASWQQLAELQAQSRERGVEGLMLKRRASVYGVGRQRGDWWKWKIAPLVMDAVLIGAQPGHGRRASLYTDYTFGVWHDGELVPVAKAYSGLTDEEIREVDAFVRANTTGRFGPLRAVKGELVFEIAFEAIHESTRHKSGIALRFPRINRWRTDKKHGEADSLETLRALLPGGAQA